MKHSFLPVLAAAAASAVLATTNVAAQTIDSMPPVVVKTVPESGSRDVAPGEVEIKVTFSKTMADNSWTWSTAWQNSAPESVGKPRFDAAKKTCTLKVKLEPGKTYAYWLNSPNFKGFRDKDGHPSVPYLLIFETKP